MLSNSLLAGLLATSYVLTLVLQLNPALPLNPIRLMPLVTTVGLFYAVHLTVICYVLLVVRQLLAREVFSPAWISVGVLVWLGALGSGAGAALMWANLDTFSRVLDETTVRAIAGGSLVLAGASLLFVLLTLGRHWIAPDARRTWAAALVVVAAGSVAAPMALRGRGNPAILAARPLDASVDVTPVERSGRVMLIAIDAGSLDFITGATAEGRLPNFGRVLDAGAVMHLASVHPPSAEAVWTAVATGKLPQKNGVRSGGIYRLSAEAEAVQLLPDYCFAHSLVRLGLLTEEPQTATALRTRTLWSILGTHGVSVGVVGWPLTDPAPAVRGFIVSDRYHRAAQTPAGLVGSAAVYPPDLEADVARAMEQATGEAPVVMTSDGIDSRQEGPARTDRTYDRIARALAGLRPVQVSLVRYQSLDPIGHYFLRYAVPSEFGDVTDEERRRLGGILERYYGMIDEAVGRAIAALGPDDLLLVVSGFGMEPLSPGKRIIERIIGDPDVSGTHERAPDGFLLAYGASVARGRLATRASLVDVTPTLLYFLGLPIARDMDGHARADLFRPAFTDDRPITFIPTYDR